MQTYSGACHCERVRFEVQAPAHLAVDECNCSMCSRTAYLHLIVPRERFRLLQGEESLTTYTFNTHVAKHIFCKTCGIHSFGRPRSAPDKVSVNARCLDEDVLSRLERSHFDGQNWEQTMAARRKAQPSQG